MLSKLSSGNAGANASEKKLSDLATERGEDGVDIDYYVERLKTLQAMAGFETAEKAANAANSSSPNKFEDFNLNAELNVEKVVSRRDPPLGFNVAFL